MPRTPKKPPRPSRNSFTDAEIGHALISEADDENEYTDSDAVEQLLAWGRDGEVLARESLKALGLILTSGPLGTDPVEKRLMRHGYVVVESRVEADRLNEPARLHQRTEFEAAKAARENEAREQDLGRQASRNDPYKVSHAPGRPGDTVLGAADGCVNIWAIVILAGIVCAIIWVAMKAFGFA